MLYKVAANGDRLYECVTGQFTATGSVGSSVIMGGTGRFENATGDANFVSMWINAPTRPSSRSTARSRFDSQTR
jgi:hypothetical protein